MSRFDIPDYNFNKTPLKTPSRPEIPFETLIDNQNIGKRKAKNSTVKNLNTWEFIQNADKK